MLSSYLYFNKVSMEFHWVANAAATDPWMVPINLWTCLPIVPAGSIVIEPNGARSMSIHPCLCAIVITSCIMWSTYSRARLILASCRAFSRISARKMIISNVDAQLISNEPGLQSQNVKSSNFPTLTKILFFVVIWAIYDSNDKTDDMTIANPTPWKTTT